MNITKSEQLKRSSKAFGAYLMKRMTGKKYGKALLEENKLRILPSIEIQKFIDNIEQYGFPKNGVISPLSQPKVDELIRRVSPIIKNDKTNNSGEYAYFGMGDRILVQDRKNNKIKLFLLTEAKQPTRDFFRYIIYKIKESTHSFF